MLFVYLRKGKDRNVYIIINSLSLLYAMNVNNSIVYDNRSVIYIYTLSFHLPRYGPKELLQTSVNSANVSQNSHASMATDSLESLVWTSIY